MRIAVLSTLGVALLVSAGCTSGRESGKGFALPAGDVEAGKAVFVAMNCGSCHSIRGESDTAPAGAKTLKIGGTTTRLPTDGYLVTSIINPSHSIRYQEGVESTLPTGQSRMLNFNDALTVRQLVDLIAYLQSVHEFDTVYQGHGLP